MDKDINVLRSRLRDSIDVGRAKRIQDLTRVLLAVKPTHYDMQGQPQGNGATTSGWSHFEPWRPSGKSYDRLNYLQNMLRIITAQTRAIDLNPQWINTEDELVATGRAEWWKWRAHGMDGLGGWKTDLDHCFADFAALGEGYVRLGLAKGAHGMATTVSHVHPLNLMTAPYAKYSNESPWVCFSTVYSVEEASERFPNFDFEAEAEASYHRTGIRTEGCRIVEYYDRASREGAVSYAAFADEVDGKVIDQGENPFGDVLPYQAFLGFIPSGSDQPIGLVATCQYVQRELERIDDDFRKKSQRDNLLGIPPELFNREDLEAYADGRRPEFLRLDAQYLNKTEDPSRHIVTVPRNGENADQKERRQELVSILQQLSGVSSLDMGTITGNQVTATEVSQVANRSQSQISYYAREFARGMQELAAKVGSIARDHDTDPFCVNVNGVPVWFNAGDVRLSSKVLFDGSLTAVLGDEDLILTDVNEKRDREGAKWLQVLQVTGQPLAWQKYLESQGIRG